MLVAATTTRDLFNKYKASTPVTLQFGYNELQDALRAGTVTSATFGLYRFKGLERQVPNNDLAWAAAPSVGPNDKHTVYGFQLSINAKSPRKDAAWEFVKHMTSPAAQIIAARGGEVVARTSAYNDPYFATPEAADQQGWKQLVQQLPDLRARRERGEGREAIRRALGELASKGYYRLERRRFGGPRAGLRRGAVRRSATSVVVSGSSSSSGVNSSSSRSTP